MEETIKALASQVEHLQKLYDWQVAENQRLRRDVEEANARAYVMARELALWQSRAAWKETE